MRVVGTVIAALLVMVATASAHHSPAAFDLAAQITIQGKVSRFDWTNPHVYIYVTTTGAAGETTEWMIETDGTSLLTRSGWRRETLPIGSLVTVRANPDRNAARHHAILISLALESGAVLTPRVSGAAAASRATSVAGVWNGLRGFTARRIGTLSATPRGLAAVKAYSVAQNPVTKCVPYATPFLPSLPYLNEIEILKDRVIIRNEFLNVDRVVHMDGRGHPSGGPRTIQGHSIGRWEGNVLVVDTALFADHLLGNYLGSGAGPRELPSGPRKHVVERFHLSEDRTRLLIDVVVEDPDYLAEPMTTSLEWDYAPQLQLLRFGCEPEQAQRYLIR
jgi:hypothetical protein